MGIKVRAQEKPPYEPVEPGEYKARLTNVEESLDGLYGPQVQFDFEIIDDEDYSGHSLRGWTPLKQDEEGNFTFWDGTKLWAWAMALRDNRPIEPDEEFELTNLLNAECRLIVVHKKKEDGTITDKIDNVLPPKKGKSKHAVTQQPEAEPVDPDEGFESIPF